jgi:16S rRNA (adenine1518-N6/adenine1519-N6)-dimethyltransferase
MIPAKKSLGQNFLRNIGAISSIVRAAGDISGKKVLEIGPGLGDLTAELLARGSIVTAIEKDARLIPHLHERFSTEISSGMLRIIEADFLEIDLALMGPSYVIVANIPYYITGALMRKVLSRENPPETAVLLVQKEVGERVIAKDGKESLLSLAVKLYGKPSVAGIVKKEQFSPRPKVDSAILAITDIAVPHMSLEEEGRFWELTRAAFNQKRKTLGASLRTACGQESFGNAGIAENRRPESLSIAEWMSLIRSCRS